jgi:hypothetical protein
VAFTVWGLQPRRGDAHRWDVAAACNGCGGPLLAVAHTPHHGNLDLRTLGHGLDDHPDVRIEHAWPQLLPVDAPLHCPPEVARAFIEAALCRRSRDGMPTAACAMYRRTLELALQAFTPGVNGLTLMQRIERLARAHQLTPAMRDWAHEIRLDGNQVLHGTAEGTRALADQMHDFTSALLMYLYTLPEQVRAARLRREAAG